MDLSFDVEERKCVNKGGRLKNKAKISTSHFILLVLLLFITTHHTPHKEGTFVHRQLNPRICKLLISRDRWRYSSNRVLSFSPMQQPCSPPKPLLFLSAIPLSLFSSFNAVSSSTLGFVPLPCSTTSSKRLPNPHSLPWPARPWTPDPDRLPLPVALQALPSQDNNNSSSNNKTAPVLQSERHASFDVILFNAFDNW